MTIDSRWPLFSVFILVLSMSVLSACGDDSNNDPPVDTIDAGGSSDTSGGETSSDECSPEDCGGALGMPNYLCDDGVTMAGPGDCELQENGECGWTIVECPADEFDACEDKTCGEQCDPCDPNAEGGCPDIAVEWYCDPSGTCVDNNVTCDEDLCADVVCPGTIEPYCEGDDLHEGYAPICEPTTGECIDTPGAQPGVIPCEYGCAEGACLPDPGKPYDPCEGKACGETCSSCDPSDEECTETAEEKACNHSGICEGSFDVTLCAYEACEPGTQFPASDGCNTCACPEEGYTLESQCTEEDCTSCEPGSEFMADDGCNTCTCPDSGNKDEAACTKKLCTCKSNDECGEGTFCDFEGDSCGVWGQAGSCVEKPQGCVAGGPGACGCDGNWATNACELQAKGTDHMQFGGCMGLDPVALFACGDTECQIEGEFCIISANDIAGPDQPEFYSSCGTLPEGCASGDCSCMETQEWEACYDGTGYTMMFYPGG